MVSLPAGTIYLFGISAFLAGLHNLLSPQTAILTFDLPVTAIPAMNGNSLAAIAMGIYYTLAAYQENDVFFALTVPMRLLSTAVFWSQSRGLSAGQSESESAGAQAWMLAAAWEGGGAVLTAAALVWTWRVSKATATIAGSKKE